MPERDGSVELSASTANALAHYFGFQQWLCPNAPIEYAHEGLRHFSALCDFAEQYNAIGDHPDGIFEDGEAAARHLWQYVFTGQGTPPWDARHPAIQDAFDQYSDQYHPHVVAYLTSEADTEVSQ